MAFRALVSGGLAQPVPPDRDHAGVPDGAPARVPRRTRGAKESEARPADRAHGWGDLDRSPGLPARLARARDRRPRPIRKETREPVRTWRRRLHRLPALPRLG